MNLRKILTLVFGSLHGEIRTVLLRDDIRAADAHATAALWTEGTLAMLADGGTGGGVLDLQKNVDDQRQEGKNIVTSMLGVRSM